MAVTRPAGSATARYSAGMMIWPVGVAQAREALVEDGPALRQGHHGLQVEVDAVRGQGLADDLQHTHRRAHVMAGAGGEIGCGRLVLEPAAHLVDEILQHVDLVGERDRSGDVGVDGPGDDGDPAVDLHHLVQQDLVGVAHGFDLTAQIAHLQEAHDHPVGGEAQAKSSHQGGDRYAPARAVAPQGERHDQREAQVGRNEEREGEPPHGSCSESPGVSALEARDVEFINHGGGSGLVNVESGAARAGVRHAATGRPRPRPRGRGRTGCSRTAAWR